jgi:hypothetical protein
MTNAERERREDKLTSSMLLVSLSVLALSGCGKLLNDTFDKFRDIDINLDGGDIGIDTTAGKGVGEACNYSQLFDCRFGLQCKDGICQVAGNTKEFDPCILTAECQQGLHCSVAGVCRISGQGDVGASCFTAGDCLKGLVCKTVGFSGTCVEAGPGDIGAACEAVDDCMAGLACHEDKVCGGGSPPFGLKMWTGVTCDDEDTSSPARVHFEVPRASTPPIDDGDFFRLPFPNDIRMKDGRVDLTGFPTPGPGIVGFDVIDRVARAAEAVQTGASTAPAILFRLSRSFDLGSVWAAGIASPPPGEPTLYFVNIDKDSPQFGATPDFGYFVTDGGSRYICPRYVAIHPAWHSPLLPSTTYAVILADGIKTQDGTNFAPDSDMLAMLNATSPTDPDLASAWEAYAPLRGYLADPAARLSPARVLAAAVFTTQSVSDLIPEVREVIHSMPAPQPAQITTCAAGVKSPCDDGLTGDKHVRGCFEESAELWEVHLTVPLPKVQKGTRPYLEPDQGGDISRDSSGRFVPQGNEEVCVSLTIPKNVPMPETGWPLAIYGHGTGGTFRSSVRDAGLPLSNIQVDGQAIGVATLGWDGPMHGNRRGLDLDPDGLFYNFANPLAARGNLIQGAADLFALTRAVKSWKISAAQSPTGAEIRFDPSKMLYIGHSQGATTGSLATPYEPDLRSVIWSGAGAGLVLSMLSKTKPVSVPLATAVALQELRDNMPIPLNDLHPGLGLVQGLFDPMDPLNHGRVQTVERDPAHPIQHVLHVYGLDDSYAPPSTIETYARTMRLALANPALKELGSGFQKLDLPIRENLTVSNGKATAVLIQVRPTDYDGHFVLFRDAEMKRRYQQWVGTFVRDGIPTLVQ